MQWQGKFGLLSPGKASSHSTAIPNVFVCFSCAVRCFRVSVIHRTLTWTTGSLTCVGHHSYACVLHVQGGWVHRQRVNIAFCRLGKTLTKFYCAPDGVRTSGLWISCRCSNNWATPSPQIETHCFRPCTLLICAWGRKKSNARLLC